MMRIFSWCYLLGLVLVMDSRKGWLCFSLKFLFLNLVL